jgi:D-tyrosyl-tRNA(Tyr) deacylase
MKAVVQRTSWARVHCATGDGGEDCTADAGAGMLILLGVMKGDGEAQAEKLAGRIARFRFFMDDAGRMNLSALDLEREVVVVSQFTLAADGRSGRRPSFDRAAPPEEAEPLYEHFVQALRGLGLEVSTGRFGAMMRVELENDGPVTFALEEAP